MIIQNAGAVILGAGFSRRFGTDKRLHALGNASVAETTVKTYQKSFKNLRVVIRTEDLELNNLLQSLNVEIITSENAKLGMGHSLSDGIRNLEWEWAFIALLDMPFVKPDSLKKLVQSTQQTKYQKYKIVRPRIESKPTRATHPVGFHKSLYPELGRSRGDNGAKSVLQQYRKETQFVELDDQGLWLDIDKPSDLEVLAQTDQWPN